MRDEKIEVEMKNAMKDGAYSRLAIYNKPMYFIVVAIIASIVSSMGKPISGGLIKSYLLVLLSIPLAEIPAAFPEEKGTAVEIVKRGSIFFMLVLFGMCIILGISGFTQKYLFSLLGEKTTLEIRKRLYGSIL